MSAQHTKNSINSIVSHDTSHDKINAERSTAKLLQKIAKELYQRNLDIRKEEARLDELLNSVAEIIFAVDQNYDITLFNSISEGIFGITENYAVGKNANFHVKIYDYKTNERIFIEQYAFKRKLFSIPKVKIFVKHNQETIERYYALRSNFVDLDSVNREAIISLADITKEVEIEQYKDDFISIASHELKTPISIVKNNIWMLRNKSDLKFTETGSKYLTQVEGGIERLRLLVTELLNVSRVDQNRLIIETKQENVDMLIQDAISKYTDTLKLKNFKVLLPQKVNATINTDALKFSEIMDNFMSNAIKYSNQQSPQIKITCELTQGSFVKIAVTDNGYGIPDNDSQKIFTKFGRATEGLKMTTNGSSTGLGLYIAKGYVEAMGGQIGYITKIGEGTTFWFTAPLAINK